MSIGVSTHPVPAVSIVTPTFARHVNLPRVHELITSQTCADWEWLVFDDSPDRSSFLDQISSRQVKYLHAYDRFTIGEKRNILNSFARAKIVAHMDDDDFYAPGYLEAMMHRLNDGLDIVKLSAWLVYSSVYGDYGYWDTTETTGLHFRWAGDAAVPVRFDPRRQREAAANQYGYGFSLVYRKAVWDRIRFEPVSRNEDAAFAAAAANRFRYGAFPDLSALCAQVVHSSNVNPSFPQYRVPRFLATRLLGPPFRRFIGEDGADQGDSAGEGGIAAVDTKPELS